MNVDAYEQAAAILDAAAAGEHVAGFEAVGALLVDLRTTTPVPTGTALRSSAVAAATAATSPGRLAGVASLVKPGVIVLGVTSLAFAFGLSVRSPSGASPQLREPAEQQVGVERVVGPATSVSRIVRTPDEEADEAPARQSEAQMIDGQPASVEPVGAPNAAPSGDPEPTSPSVPAESSSTTAPAVSAGPTAPPSTALPPTTSTPPVTTGPPSTAVAPTTSTAPPPEQTSTTTEPHGNNGNGNGNGVGNGKGNHGNGGGNGNGNPGGGAGGPGE